MHKILITTMLLVSIMLTGCGQEKAQVEAYLAGLKASNDTMKATAQEMQNSMSGLQQQMATGDFDAEAIKKQIAEFEGKMKAEKTKVEGLTVPEKCKTLHDTTVKQYEVALNVLGKTPAMIDIAKKMADGAKKLKADPKQAKTVMPELQAAQAEMMTIQGEVMKFAEEGQKLEETAKSERTKLQEEFKIPAEETPAPGTTPADAAPADAAAPAEVATPAAVATP